MVANFTRVDTVELKDLIYRKIGHERAEKYFDQLKRFLSLKLSKVEFDKSCVQTIGRENVSLHNSLIRSIVQNACQARIPPRKARKVEGLNVKVANGYQRNCLQSLYGDAFPQSPRKCRSPVSRDRKFRDRPSPLGPLCKSPSLTCEETVTRTQEQQSGTEWHSLCSRPPVGVVSVEDGEEVEQCAGSLNVRRWSPVTAPLGVSIGTRKDARCGYKDDNTRAESCENRGELPDTVSLRSRLQKKLAMEGVGISSECADVLNNGLDVFLKKMIEPCVSIASSKCRKQSNKAVISEFNGTLSTQSTNVTMLDFRVAMESNPRLLGVDWPVQLEKICHYASEE
ncbi:hypothetical protein C2S53_008127 [Perilla frutescens var. hirtella]|uniref:Transcriptional coactivator Hfi1/Transcriptional adapter 1 n=1 Tax=Perilla frutescens var. hirtella TaxID=608512 RepID=A0AAD4PAK7_PERFH|nr:hypothetical protein C2S51_004927 [Perilla frutescens var. frutescens]KAH6833184.1 hypothetical protein C2S53_008127 [Perilla frutescens var. hirtella]